MLKAKDYHEPWSAEVSAWDLAFRNGPPPADAEQVERWEVARERARENADWIIWGSRMVEPATACTMDGRVVVMDDRHVVVRVSPTTSINKNAPDQELLARRIAACVNACRGMAEPDRAVDAARALLVDLSTGRASADDPRILKCAILLGGRHENP